MQGGLVSMNQIGSQPRRGAAHSNSRADRTLSQAAARTLLDAIIAGSAVVAHADGIILSVEKRRMLEFIAKDRRLGAFDAKGIDAAFSAISARLDQDNEAGRREALAIVGRLAGNAELSRDCFQACCEVAAADDLVDEEEVAMLVAVCLALGLDVGDLAV